MTPLGASLCERRGRWLVMCTVPYLAVHVMRCAPLDTSYVLLGLAAGSFCLGLWLTWSFPWHAAFFTALRRLYRDLPWFKAATVNFVHPSRRKELDAALVRGGFVIHDIDGASIRSVADLIQALEEQFGAPAKPRDPYRRAAALLASAMGKRLEHHAFLWHGEHVIVAHDQAAQDLFLAAWQRLVRKSMPHVLLFLITPDAPEE